MVHSHGRCNSTIPASLASRRAPRFPSSWTAARTGQVQGARTAPPRRANQGAARARFSGSDRRGEEVMPRKNTEEHGRLRALHTRRRLRRPVTCTVERCVSSASARGWNGRAPAAKPGRSEDCRSRTHCRSRCRNRPSCTAGACSITSRRWRASARKRPLRRSRSWARLGGAGRASSCSASGTCVPPPAPVPPDPTNAEKAAALSWPAAEMAWNHAGAARDASSDTTTTSAPGRAQSRTATSRRTSASAGEG